MLATDKHYLLQPSKPYLNIRTREINAWSRRNGLDCSETFNLKNIPRRHNFQKKACYPCKHASSGQNRLDMCPPHNLEGFGRLARDVAIL
jgi:hypothetical protein